MTAWSLAAARERDHRALVDPDIDTYEDAIFDRAELLALVDRLLDGIAEARGRLIAGEPGALDVLTQAVREIDGGGTR